MTLAAFLDRLTSIIEEAGIAYMLTGSLAAAYYAEPRATRDVDLVIAVSPGQLEGLVNRLDRDGLYVSLEAAREAVRTEGQFNAVDPASGWKADLIPRKGRRFSREEFYDAGASRDHIERWVDELGLDREWARLVEESAPREAE